MRGVVTMRVAGSAIGNAELLPPVGYAPLYGRFVVSADRESATLEFDTRQFSDGRLDPMRISVFDQGPGESDAREAVVMMPRRWYVDNNPDNSQCEIYATINQLPDYRPAKLDGTPVTVQYCEPHAWPPTGMPADCECVKYRN